MKKFLKEDDFEVLKSGKNPSEIGLDFEEAVKLLCDLVESANTHLKRLNILRKRYNKLDDFICNEIMKSCLAIKGGISEKESIENIFKFYEENCT